MISHWKLLSIWISMAACVWKRLQRFVVASLAPPIYVYIGKGKKKKERKKSQPRIEENLHDKSLNAACKQGERGYKIYDNSRFDILAWNGHCWNQWQVLKSVILFLLVQMAHNTHPRFQYLCPSIRLWIVAFDLFIPYYLLYRFMYHTLVTLFLIVSQIMRIKKMLNWNKNSERISKLNSKNEFSIPRSNITSYCELLQRS